MNEPVYPHATTKAQTEEHVRFFDVLLDLPAWQLFEQQMRLYEQSELEKCVTAKTSEERTIAVGKVQAVRFMREWPRNYSRGCQEALSLEAGSPGSVFVEPEEAE